MPATALAGFPRHHRAAPPVAARVGLIAAIVAAHLLLLLLLLAQRTAPPLRDSRMLSVFDLALPPPPPPDSRLARPEPRAVQRSGGSAGRRAARPAPAAAGARPVLEATPLAAAPPSPPTGIGTAADLAGPGAAGVMGSDSGLGAGSGGGLGDALGSGSGTGGEMRWRRAEWIVKPDDRAVAHVWPLTALRERKGGIVTLACLVPRPGRPTRCRIADEQPRGYGFGRAALSLWPDFRIRPVGRNGDDVANLPVLVPVVFDWATTAERP